MEQLLAHLWGDFVCQTDWMALNKKKPGLLGWIPAIVHALVYSWVLFTALLVFGVRCSWLALIVIFVTHAVIDHYELISKFIWVRNWLSPRWLTMREGVPYGNQILMPQVTEVRNPPWSLCANTLGFLPERPDHLRWLIYIVIDNTLHLTINYAALRWL